MGKFSAQEQRMISRIKPWAAGICSGGGAGGVRVLGD